MVILEYVYVGLRNRRSSSEDEKLNKRSSWCWAEWGCQTTIQRPGNINPSRSFSADMKSVSAKCLLHKLCLDDFLSCFALQGMHRLSAHNCALCKNDTRKYWNETYFQMVSARNYVFTVMWTQFVSQTIHCMLCWLQHIGKILIYSGSNIRRLKETLETDKFVFQCRHNPREHNAKRTRCVAYMVHKIVLLQYSQISDITAKGMIYEAVRNRIPWACGQWRISFAAYFEKCNVTHYRLHINFSTN